VRTPLALYLLALVGRLVLIALHPDPAYPDSFYYADVARSLVAGHGFSVDFVWIFAEVGGKIPAVGALVGAVMKATRGQADAAAVRAILLERLGVPE